VNESAAIAMYSMMITVITFFGAFHLMTGSRMLMEFSIMIGQFVGSTIKIQSSLNYIRGKIGPFINKLKRSTKAGIQEKDVVDELESGINSDIEEIQATLRFMAKLESNAKRLRDRDEKSFLLDMIVIFGSIMILLVLLLAVGDSYWQTAIMIGWVILVCAIIVLFVHIRSLIRDINSTVSTVKTVEAQEENINKACTRIMMKLEGS